MPIRLKPRSTNSRADKADNRRRNDAALSVFFKTELEQIKRRTYDKKYPNLLARTFVPPSAEPAPPGADKITYHSFDARGAFRMISGYGQDLERIDAVGSEFSSPLKSLGGSIGWSAQEIRAAEFAGTPLKAMKMINARRAAEEAIDSIISFGNADTGLPGFLNNANVPQASVSGGTWAVKAALDPDLIVDDVSDMISDMGVLTNHVEKGEILLLPPAQFTLATLTRLVDQNVSVMDYLREALKPLGVTQILPWWRLTGAGTADSDRMVLYRRDPDLLFYEVPIEFDVHPEQWVGLQATVPIECRVGGTIMPYPLSVSYRDGI
jgi:hypothetical protein